MLVNSVTLSWRITNSPSVMQDLIRVFKATTHVPGFMPNVRKTTIWSLLNISEFQAHQFQRSSWHRNQWQKSDRPGESTRSNYEFDSKAVQVVDGSEESWRINKVFYIENHGNLRDSRSKSDERALTWIAIDEWGAHCQFAENCDHRAFTRGIPWWWACLAMALPTANVTSNES